VCALILIISLSQLFFADDAFQGHTIAFNHTQKFKNNSTKEQTSMSQGKGVNY
jgi:hypothetical protein